jgi:peptidoglycan/LPS O-acetylase OafA/YrhL
MFKDETMPHGPRESQPQQSTSHILSLDLGRGLAALIVMIYHTNFLFFETSKPFHRGYLCVDFFFLLSGYVIANSYDAKILNGFGAKQFLVVRIARLWPLVLLSTLIAFAVQVLRYRRDMPDLDNLDLAISLACNLVMMPSPSSPNIVLFPFNGAAWSIFFEMIANVIYISMFRYTTGATLGFVILGSGVALAATALAFDSLDVGMTQWNFIFGLPRVLFSFFLGILLFRWRNNFRKLPISGAPALLVGLIVAGALMSIPKIPLAYVNGLIDLLVAVSVFPILLRIAESARLTGSLGSVAWFLGGISYSVYLLQTPFMVGYSALPQVLFGQKIAAFVPWGGLLFTLMFLPAAYLCWVYFERPAQRWLRGALLRKEVRLLGADQRV